ncbi:MAG: SfnB family sulfur acquisition oxidoreductase [Patulibacter sp.]
MSTAVDHAVDRRLPEQVAVIGSDAEALATARAYAERIRPGAIDRDRERRLPHDELRELAASGLLGVRVPRALGGAEVSNATVLEISRLLATADPAIAQIPQNHYAFVETVFRFGSDAQQAFFANEFLRGARLGNALSERGGKTASDYITTIRHQPGGDYRVDGRKYYCTGAFTAQWIPVFGTGDEDTVIVAFVPHDTPGVTVDLDWTAFGQRTTFSGGAAFDAVDVPADRVFLTPSGGEVASTFAAFAQAIHAAIDVGIARGALDDGVRFLRETARPWRESAVDRAADDPALIQRVGELDVQVRASEALLDAAGRALDVADADPDPESITAARLAVAASKTHAGETALRVATEIFDLAGSSAADERHGLDRHWRNARTHTLHDPARSKHAHLGRYLIDGVAPPAGHALI